MGKYSLQEVLSEPDYILLERLRKEMFALKSSPNYKNSKLMLEASEQILANQRTILAILQELRKCMEG